MAHITYGFDATFPNKPDDPWTRLDTIREYLEDCEPIPQIWRGGSAKPLGIATETPTNSCGDWDLRRSPADRTTSTLKMHG